MEKRARTRSQIIKRELQLRLIQEKTLIGIFVAALAYSLMSNIVYRCCPIECVTKLAILGNATDELFRNISYSILAGIIFYFINDIYKNVVKRVSDMDDMFRELVNLDANAYNALLTISNNNYKKGMNKEQVYQCVIKNLCNKDVEFQLFGSPFKNHTIGVENCALLVNNWKDANKVRYDFLSAYGNLLERQEVFRLNGFDDNLVSDIIGFLSIQFENTNNEFVKVSDYDITLIVNRFINYKLYLANIAKKYVKYNYRRHYLNRLCVEDDFF